MKPKPNQAMVDPINIVQAEVLDGAAIEQEKQRIRNEQEARERKKREEQLRKQREAEEKKRQEEEAKRRAEEKRQEEIKQAQEEKRQAEEKAKKEAEARQKAELERKQAEEKARNLALYDQLTGIPNRTLIQDRLSQLLAASSRTQHFGALLFLDMEHF